MKKKLALMLTLTVLSAALLTGCGSKTEQDSSTDGEQTQEIANPWTETDEQGVLDATGFDMVAPDGATDVSYSYMAEGGMAQMAYELDGASWLYRMQLTDGLTNISGMEYGWTTEEEGGFLGMAANFYAYTTEDESQNDVQLAVWYDALTGVSYSLSASGEDLSGMDIQAYAESIYTSLQGEATDDADADRENELNEFFLGEHKRSSDDSVLTISENEDGTFNVNLSITRLCSLENGVGAFEDHKMTFTVTDPSDNEMSGEIYRDSDNSLTVKITNSTWELLPADEVLDGFGK